MGDPIVGEVSAGLREGPAGENQDGHRELLENSSRILWPRNPTPNPSPE